MANPSSLPAVAATRAIRPKSYTGIAGSAIPLFGRITTIADVFDALTNERPYKPAWPLERAVEEMRSERGRQFDPEGLDAFLIVVERTGAAPPAEA